MRCRNVAFIDSFINILNERLLRWGRRSNCSPLEGNGGEYYAECDENCEGPCEPE